MEDMATEEQKDNLEENTSEVPLDRELFAGEVHEELSEREAFAGDEDFYKRLADSAQDATAGQPDGASQPPLVPIRYKYYFSNLQKVLVVSIVAIAAILLYALTKSPSQPAASPSPTEPTVRQASSVKPPIEDAAQKLPQQPQESEPMPSPAEPMSLDIAQTFYIQKDYNKAYAAYSQLRQNLPTSAKDDLLRDFLQLRMALCMKEAFNIDQAGSLFGTVLQSRSPVIRVLANYYLIFVEMQKKQYLKARTRAYQAIALIGSVDFDRNWALAIERDCHFLIAESVTRNVLSLWDIDKNLPGELWGDKLEPDPFINLSEAQLRSFLNSGSEQLSKALLGPQIQKRERLGALPRWFVVCHGASNEELLARFAANADLDINWAHGRDLALGEVKDALRERPVSLYLPAATAQQVVTVAAGCVGLLAQIDDKGTVNICDPADYRSLSEHIALLSQEAVSLWQKFLLTFHSDKRIANAHFALGLLHAQRGQVTNAIAEYKLLANRFSKTSLAPFALLNSSKLKTNLRDYPGARQDLNQLIEQYPDTDIANRACLYLADATMKAQLYEEAGKLYSRVYNLGLSLELQTAAALGGGRCFYEKKDYQAAVEWLTRYISLVRDPTSPDLYSAYFLLGKTYMALGNPKQACDAFQYALAGQLPKEEYAEAVLALVKGYMEQECFIEALDVLENAHSWQFSREESIEILLLKSKILREMGLIDKAIATLGDRAQYLSESQLKAKVSFELTKCYIARGNLELAHRNLTEILILAEPGALAHEIALELADVCLKLGQNSQTISICLQLLDSDPSEQIKQKALYILATAYDHQKDYDKAALALLGRWDTRSSSKKTAFDNPVGAGELPLGGAK